MTEAAGETVLAHRVHLDVYADLVASRKVCHDCAGQGLTNPSRVLNGSLDSDHIGPYSRWQGNLKAELVVVGQDFADVQTFTSVQGWPGEEVWTNLNLVELVALAGVQINPPKRNHPDNRLFFTNAVLCLKEDSMGQKVPAACSRRCGTRFLRPTINLIAPRAVAALGRHALNAILTAFKRL